MISPKALLTLTALVASLPLTSCVTTTDPYTGQQGMSKGAIGTGAGAAIGAGLGAIIGNNVGDNDSKDGAMVGAAIGGLVGGGVGVYMDKQEAQIRQRLQGTGVSVTRSGNNLILNMPHAITFRVADDTINPGFNATLGSVAMVLREFDKTRVSVDGHTDSDGTDAYNIDLSQRRAFAVSSVLAQNGVAPQRLIARGLGEAFPIAPNTTPDAKAANRRVEIHIVPVQ